MDATITQEIAQEVKERFGMFIEKEINPGVIERDTKNQSVPKELYRQACQIGMTLYPLSPELGGDGASKMSWGMMLEQVGYLCEDLSFPSVVSLHTAMIKTLYQSNRQDIFERYVQPMIRGDITGAFAYTDGADPFSFKTCARKTEGGYIISGAKHYTTGGDIADVFMTYVRDTSSDDLQVFLIEKNDPGVKVEPLALSGYRSAGVSRVYLNDVFVPESRLLVKADGLTHIQFFLNSRRVILICPLIGRMQAIFERCIGTLNQSIRYGKPLTAMQGVQAQIGKMYKLIETSRAIVYRALARESSGMADELWDEISSLAKFYTTDSAIELVLIAQRLLGGDGQLEANHYGRYLRDFCSFIPGGGTQESINVDLGVMAISKFEMFGQQ